MDEFAMGSTCETSGFNHTRNPWDIHRVPGGSSGGSAVAVASGMVPLALGSDTGGSIRQPAAFCGIAGLKPTYGLVSRYGLASYASSLDQIGPMSRDVYGNAALLNIISGHDVKDSTSLEAAKADYCAGLDGSIKGLRIAVVRELSDGVSQPVQVQFSKAIKTLEEAGAIVSEISLSCVKYVISSYYFIATAEACSNLSRYDGVKYGFRSGKQSDYQEMLFTTRSYGFGKEVKKRILLGNFVLSSGYYDEYYRKAQKVRALIREELRDIFKSVDVIAMPTAPDIAFPHGESQKDPMKMYLSDITTVMPNLAGLPAISVPCGLADGMPSGIQFMCRPLEEQTLLKTAAVFENRQGMIVPYLGKILETHTEAMSVKMNRDANVSESIHHDYSKENIKRISESYNKRKKTDPKRIYCNELLSMVGKNVVLAGWIHKKKNLGGIEFYDLRDRTGFTQLVIEGEKPVERINSESVVEVSGKVTREERSPFGNIEIKVKNINVVSHAEGSVPVSVNSPLDNVNLPTILDNRTISVRNPGVLFAFKIQSEIVKLFSEYLHTQNFTEIKSPKIISSGTEGGTNIFEVKYFDRTAYLAQSPQFYKQIMVGSGLERVFEIGPVFRAEHHDTIRHLNEYISLDFELGFIRDEQDVINMQENLIKYIFTNIRNKYKDERNIPELFLDVPDKIPRIHFLEAMDIIESMGVRDIEEGDISPAGEKALCEYFEKEKDSPFVYVIGYPVKKRPMYTMPDERLPGYTRSFDLLYRGIEITTGGQRIHDYHQLRENIVEFGFNPGEYMDYLSIFKYGMPPHGGLGMGLERITMKICNLKNIREASLFPRDINRITP